MPSESRRLPRRSKIRQVRQILLAAMHGALARFHVPAPEPLELEAADDLHKIEISLKPIGRLEQAAASTWLPLSPLEALIVDKLKSAKSIEPGRAVLGKNLARALDLPYDTRLKTILRNLVDRRVLTHDDDVPGYSIAPRSGQ